MDWQAQMAAGRPFMIDATNYLVASAVECVDSDWASGIDLEL